MNLTLANPYNPKGLEGFDLYGTIFGGSQLDSGQNQSLPSNWTSAPPPPVPTSGGWSSNPADWVTQTPGTASTGWTSTGGGYTGGGYTGSMPAGLGGTPAANDTGTGWAGLLDTFSDIGSSLSGLFGGLGFGGGTTPAINPYSTPSTGGGYQQTNNVPAQTQNNLPAPPPPATPPATPPAVEEKPKFFTVEEGSNWLMNKLVIAGKFKIPYWFGLVLIGVAFWKRKQITAVFKKK